MSEPYATFDPSNTPIYIVRFTGNVANDDNFQAYLDGLSKLYVNPAPLAIVFHAEEGLNIGHRYQRMQAAWIKENERLIGTYCQGTAYVIKSRILRATLRAIFAIQRQAAPFHITSDLNAAMRWCHDQLDRAEQGATG